MTLQEWFHSCIHMSIFNQVVYLKYLSLPLNYTKQSVAYLLKAAFSLLCFLFVKRERQVYNKGSGMV